MNKQRQPNWSPSNWMMKRRPGLHFKTPSIVDLAMSHHKGQKRIVIQAGGHIGIWPAKLSDHFDKVISFEPVIENWLAANSNMSVDNVLLIPCCLSSINKSVRVQDHGENTFGGSAGVVQEQYGKPSFLVAAMQIDALPEWIRSGIDAIFLDVEGHELDILTGASKTIKKLLPTIVIEENGKSLMKRKAGDVERFLSTMGYSKVAQERDDIVFCARS